MCVNMTTSTEENCVPEAKEENCVQLQHESSPQTKLYETKFVAFPNVSFTN